MKEKQSCCGEVNKMPFEIDTLRQDLATTRAELERWKKMAQRNNPSGCCCRIDDSNGDPKMIEPCAFHAEWRDGEIESLQRKEPCADCMPAYVAQLDKCPTCGRKTRVAMEKKGEET